MQILIGPTPFFSKICLLLLFYRTFSIDKFVRYKLYGALVFTGLTMLILLSILFALCLPGKHNAWPKPERRCHSTVVSYYIRAVSAVAFNLFAIYLPAIGRWSLTAPKAAKSWNPGHLRYRTILRINLGQTTDETN